MVGSYHMCGLSPARRPARSATVRVRRLLEGLAAISCGAHGSYPAPLTTAYCAWATVRPSWGVGSYTWGSVFGLVMTLITWAWSPPSCVAMLPQKFSAATTRTLPPPVLPVAEAPQPASSDTAENAPATIAASPRLLRMVVMTDRP